MNLIPKFQIPNSKFRDIAAIALIAILVLLFFWRIITPRLADRAAFPPGDFTDQFWAFRMYEARAFAQGRLPLWSENFNSGHPFLADVQSAIFYPIGLIWTLIVVALRGANFNLLDLEIEAIFHFILVGAFTYLFAKRLLGSRLAALLGALTFTFGGYLTSYPPLQLAILETVTWLPLILLFFDLAIERGTCYYILAGLALGIAALAGHPQTFLFVGYVSVIFFIWRTWDREAHLTRSRFTHYVSRLILVGIIALGIASAQYIPTIEYQTVSTRAAISWADASGGFPTLDPLQMILPGFASAFQSPLYIGILPLWFALFGLFVNRSHEKYFWILLALGSLLVSFGAYVFVYAIFYLIVPGFAMFRGQERLALVVSFSLAMLAAYGARELIASPIDWKRARRAWVFLPIGIVVSALMLFTMYIGAREFQTGRMFLLTDRAAFMTLVFALATVLISLLLAKRNASIWILLVGLILFDLFTIGNPAYNAAIKDRYPITSLIETIQNDGDVFRVADEGTQPGHFGIGYRLEEIGGISPLRVDRYNQLLDHLPPENLWRLLNVRYVLTKRPGFPNAAVIDQDGDVRLLRLQNNLPRAWFVASIQTNVDDTAALAAMSNDAFDPRAIAYLADDAPNSSNDVSHNSAQIIKQDPEHLVISVDATNAAMLMISQVYYPGWQATIDSTPSQLYRADVALIGISIPPGAHQIDLIYDPISVKIGTIVSALTLVTSAIALVIGFARK